MFKISNHPVILLAIITIVCFVIYMPGLSGGYIFDDYINILQNESLRIPDISLINLLNAAGSGISGPTGRPVSMLSFAFNMYIWGQDPFYMKLINLFLHIINGYLIYQLTLLILGLISNEKNYIVSHKYFALFVSAAWLLHPVNLTNILYVVQRMNLLSCMFTLGGIITYIKSRSEKVGLKKTVLLSFLVITFGVLASLSKENGLLMFLFIIMIEITFFRFYAQERKSQIIYIGIFSTFVIILSASAGYFLYSHPDYFQHAYAGRDFTLYQRILTEFRVLWFYIYLICLPNIKQMGIYHDQFSVSYGLLDPITTILSILGLVTTLIAAFALRKEKIFFFGILFFLIGHSLESTILPLELVFEHRNYLPSYGILIMLFGFILHNQQKLRTASMQKGLATVLIVLFSFSTFVRAEQWGDPGALMLYELNRNPESPRSNYAVARLYTILMLNSENSNVRSEMYNHAKEYYQKTRMLEEDGLAPVVGLMLLKNEYNKKIDDQELQMLLHDAKNSLLDYTDIESINSLLNCVAKDICNIETLYISELIKNIDDNVNVFGNRKALLDFYISRYFMEHGHNIELAIRYAERTKENKPGEMGLKLYLANLYILQGNNQKALEYISEVKKNDLLGLYTDVIVKLEKAIDMKSLNNVHD